MKFAVVGLASAMLWGCVKNVTKEDLGKQITSIESEFQGSLHDIEDFEKQITYIENTFKGNLHEIEIDRLRRARDLATQRAASSSERRYLQKSLKHEYEDAKDLITKEQVEELLTELGRYFVTGHDLGLFTRMHLARDLGFKIRSQFEKLTEDQKTRLVADLKAELARIKIFIERGNAIKAKIDEIQGKIRDNLIDFESVIFRQIIGQPLSASDFHLFNEFLDSIYVKNPKYPAVTRQEIEDRIRSGADSFSLQDVLRNYSQLTEAQLKRVKGWFVSSDRFIEEEKRRRSTVDV